MAVGGPQYRVSNSRFNSHPCLTPVLHSAHATPIGTSEGAASTVGRLEAQATEPRGWQGVPKSGFLLSPRTCYGPFLATERLTMSKATGHTAYASNATYPQYPGRSDRGALRNFKAMSDGKFIAVFNEVVLANNDMAALRAVETEYERREKQTGGFAVAAAQQRVATKRAARMDDVDKLLAALGG